MQLQDKLFDYIQSKFHTFQSLIFGMILILFILAGLDAFIEKFLPDRLFRCGIYAFILIVWTFYWVCFRFYLPKNKNGRVGLVVAIYAENNQEQQRLKADLIDKLKKNIDDQDFSNIINLIEIKNHIAKQIKSNKDIIKTHKKIKGNFYLYGTIKKRNNGVSTYFLDIEGMVTHKPIGIDTQNKLLKEFVRVLPKQVSFSESIEFQGFKITTDIIYLAVKYIVGIAIYLSGNPHLAIVLHKNLLQDLNNDQFLPPNLKEVKIRIPKLISEEECLIARVYYNNANSIAMKESIDNSFKSNPNNYGTWLLQSIYDFKYGAGAEQALKSITQAKKCAGAPFEWRYSQAFLEFWLEKYKDALHDCEKLCKSTYLHEIITIKEVEDFENQLLKENNFPSQLYFWLGFLNYKKKNNLPQALIYFEEFEKQANTNMKILLEKSNSYLREIRKAMEVD